MFRERSRRGQQEYRAEDSENTAQKTACILLCFFLILSQPLMAREWYTSSKAGIPLDSLQSGPLLEGWSLSVEELGGQKITQIYLDGKEYFQSIDYRSQDRLIAQEQFNADGELQKRIEYAYDSNGNVRFVSFSPNIDGSEPAKISTKLSRNIDWDGTRIQEGTKNRWQLTDRTDRGQNVRELVLEKDDILKETIYDIDEEGMLLGSLLISDDLQVKILFDEDGNKIKETTILSGIVLSDKKYQWKDTKLIQFKETNGINTTRKEIEWKKDLMIREQVWKNKEKIKDTVWESANNKIEIFFRNNYPVIRVYWKDNLRVREEFIKPGSQRTRISQL